MFTLDCITPAVRELLDSKCGVCIDVFSVNTRCNDELYVAALNAGYSHLDMFIGLPYRAFTSCNYHYTDSIAYHFQVGV